MAASASASASAAAAGGAGPSAAIYEGLAAASSQASATLAGGCFWCVEAPYSDLKGVSSAVSGYIGGSKPNPTYEEVCRGTTGHAEAVRITYDPSIISFSTLLDVFFVVHDPTQLNRQGNDSGTQYRSAIFVHSEQQLAEARAKIESLSSRFVSPIVTQLDDAKKHEWYPAEEYHQNYSKVNPSQGYIVGVSQPKYNKVRKTFPHLFR